MKAHLTKSDFIRYNTCPTAAFYTWQGLGSLRADDPFQEYLKKEGQDVRATAKRLFDDGVTVTEADPLRADGATQKHLRSDGIVFNGVIIASGYLARPDIVIRKGDTVYVVAIHTKAADMLAHRAGRMLMTMYGNIRAAWREVVYGIGFDCAAIRLAFPGLKIVPWLLLPDANTPASAEEIEYLDFDSHKPLMVSRDALERRREQSVLKFFNASEAVAHVADDVFAKMKEMTSARESGLRPEPQLRYACRNCEFRTGMPDDGFHRCWGELAQPDPHLFDLHQLYSLKVGGKGQALLADAKIAVGRTSLYHIDEDELHGDHKERQRLQLRGMRENREIIDPRLGDAMAQLSWPIAFLDFETVLFAIPRYPGVKPYETLPFQFSCHVVNEDGSYEHREWLNVQDRMPTLKFVQALQRVLNGVGSILVYTSYEERILKEARACLAHYGDDTRQESIWLFELLQSGRIVDQHAWVYRWHFAPAFGGRTSIKKVLPAVWESNPSLWRHPAFFKYYQMHDGVVLDPYATLPTMQLDGEGFSVREGCAAMAAYGEMIHGAGAHCPEIRAELAEQLRRYCALDTLSQWIIFEHWGDKLGVANLNQSSQAFGTKK